MGTPTMAEVKATVFVITLADKETSNQEHVRKKVANGTLEEAKTET